MKRAFFIFLSIVATIAFFTRASSAHGMRTAYIELRERSSSSTEEKTFVVDVLTRTGATYGAVRVVMPEGCLRLEEATSTSYTCTQPLAGSLIRIEGLGPIVNDAVIVAIDRDGVSSSGLVRASESTFTIPPSRAADPSGTSGSIFLLARYVRAGFLHVLAGADHLLFLAALVIALRRFRAVVIAETAFTISHSIAFSAAALGWIHVPARVAEAAIALSLVLLAIDLNRRRRSRGVRSMTMTTSAGARSAFVFGAVHGLGFAGGLQELGVPRNAVLPALVGFAGGVEVAQIVFLLACFGLLALAHRVGRHVELANVTGYAVGITGVFWLFERSLAFLR